MTRSLIATLVAAAVLFVAPLGSVLALEVAGDIDGGSATAPERAALGAPAARPELIIGVPETAPRSSAAPQAVPEELAPVSKASPTAASATLGGLNVGQRANARISLEPMGNPSFVKSVVAAQVEELWTSGRYNEAIVQLEGLESSGQHFAVLISWQQPVATPQTKYYPDSRISTRTGGQDLALDFHPGTGNIFALVVWGSGWTLHISTDRGATWNETHYWSGYTAIADMAVAGDYVWVGYSATGDSYHTSRFRRLFADTGLEDSDYDFQLVGDAGTNTITDIKVVANTPDNNNRIYMAYLVDETDSIHFWWDDLGGTAFTEIPTAITDAASSLDAAWNPYAPIYKRWISYLGTDGNVHLARSDGLVWQPEISYPFSGAIHRTALSAYSDHIFCAFECESEPGKYGICFLESQDGGVGSWLHDDAYWPTGDEPSGYAPDISVRSGVGAAVVFGSETGDIDDVYYTTRRGWTPGAWTEPQWYNTYDHVSGEDTYIEWIGSLCVGSYGMAYFDGDGDHSPHFDLMTPRGLFCDGFESGDTGAWD